jgi:nitroreductase
MNAQEIDVYVASGDGLFLYDAAAHALRPLSKRDVRPLTSGQEFIKAAPLALIFVADLARMTKAKPEQREFYAGMDTGYISQNVYLYCASADLGTVAHDLDRGPLAQAMGLRSDQRIMLAQAVGYPKTP